MHSLKLLTAIGLVSAFVTSAMAQSASPNAEGCVEKTWGYLRATSYEYGALNTCDYPVAISFKPRNGQMVQSTVQPGEIFRTGLTYAKFEADRKKTGWVASVCRAGEVPDRAISDSSWDAILNGKYECRKP